MAKRRISKRQQARITQRQQQRLTDLDSDISGIDDGITDEPRQSGLVVAHLGKAVIVETETGEEQYCRMRQNLPLLVPGDRVVWQAATTEHGVVIALQPRRSSLSRQNTDGSLRPLAANIDTVFITQACLPAPQPLLLDKYLVAIEHLQLNAVIVLNKMDLLQSCPHQEQQRIHTMLETYRNAGYPVLCVSATTEQGLVSLRHELNGISAVFVGPSGVGKSSLIAYLTDDESIRCGELSVMHDLGKHTTTTARFYHLQPQGGVIDSPGVREFDLWPMTRAQLQSGFVDIDALAKQCKFRDCRHLQEPSCAVRAAVEQGQLQQSRLTSWHTLLSSHATRSG